MIDTSNEQCAAICMVVTNPGDKPRRDGWQKCVNDLIRALRDERNGLLETIAELRTEHRLEKLKGSGFKDAADFAHNPDKTQE